MVCHAGLDIGKVHGNALACIVEPKQPCDLREEFTVAEIVAKRTAMEAAMKRLFQCLAVLPEPVPGASGDVACPACKVGRISYVFSSSNAHLHAHCSTDDCFNVHQ